MGKDFDVIVMGADEATMMAVLGSLDCSDNRVFPTGNSRILVAYGEEAVQALSTTFAQREEGRRSLLFGSSDQMANSLPAENCIQAFDFERFGERFAKFLARERLLECNGQPFTGGFSPDLMMVHHRRFLEAL